MARAHIPLMFAGHGRLSLHRKRIHTELHTRDSGSLAASKGGPKSTKRRVSVCFLLYPSQHTDMAQHSNPRCGRDVKLSHGRWAVSEGRVWSPMRLRIFRIDWVPVTHGCTYIAPLNWTADNNYSAPCSGYLLWSKPGVRVPFAELRSLKEEAKQTQRWQKGYHWKGIDHFSQGKQLRRQLCDPPCEPRQGNAENRDRRPGWWCSRHGWVGEGCWGGDGGPEKPGETPAVLLSVCFCPSPPHSNVRLPGWLSGKESACRCRRRRFHPSVGKIPWRRKWQPASVFLPGKSHGQRSLVGSSPEGAKRIWHETTTTATPQHRTTCQGKCFLL